MLFRSNDTATTEIYTRPYTLSLHDALPIYDKKVPLEGSVEAPSRLADLIAVAEALAHETDFVRIDGYQVGSRIVLGEMTHCPGTGLSPLYPAIWDDRFGAMWERRLE